MLILEASGQSVFFPFLFVCLFVFFLGGGGAPSFKIILRVLCILKV